jgi:hypothetical protein
VKSYAALRAIPQVGLRRLELLDHIGVAAFILAFQRRWSATDCCGPPSGVPAARSQLLSAACVCLGALKLERDGRLVTHHPRVMARLDHVRLTRPHLRGGPVLVHHL